MLRLRFTDLLNLLSDPYRARMSGEVVDTREYVALVDLYVRIIYTLAIAESHASGRNQIRASGTPGFGTMLAVIRKAQAWEVEVGECWSRGVVRSSSDRLVKNIDSFRVSGHYHSFKLLRDRLSHGHALPADDAVADLVVNSLKSLCETLYQELCRCFEGVYLETSGVAVSLVLDGKANLFPVSPLWGQDTNASKVGIYSHFSSEGVCYLVPGGELYADKRTEVVLDFERHYLSERRGPGADLGRLVQDVIRDIAAFTEDYSSPSYQFGDDAESGVLFVPWTRSTSDGNQPRFDSFRIGPDCIRQWKTAQGGAWADYSSFLREVSNWQILARRISIGLERFVRERDEEEASRLCVNGHQDVRGPAHLLEVDENLTPLKDGDQFELGARVDDACQVLKPSTTVFFVVGQAGLGKTELMLSLARERASKISKDPSYVGPLYLFVTSTGRTLASLEDAVNGSLNITKLLSSQGARALCRNGLLVLLVDGFDELLGSSGYENALGSLEPWFRDLGGRGVLVASARSSYYLSQYRRSLSETTGINVDHTLAEIQPWIPSEAEAFLLRCGVSKKILGELTGRDWELLGIPFFAKAFSAWVDNSRIKEGTHPAIFDIVIEQYLERESRKLADPHQGVLLSCDELQSLFAEVAEMMQLCKTRELEQGDLVVCAQQVVENDSLESARPGLVRRLSSLCGLGVDVGASRSSQFGFSHELMFDCFLSLALQRKAVEASGLLYIRELLEKGKINPAVFGWFIEREPEAAQKVMVDMLKNAPAAGWKGALSENLGALWGCLLSKRNYIPPTSVAFGLRLGDIKLSSEGWAELSLRGCTVARLELPASGTFVVRVPDTDIEFLACSSATQLKSSIRDIDAVRVKALQLEEIYADIPSQVRSSLADLGLVKYDAQSEDSSAYEAAEFFFDKLMTRSDVPIVAHRDSHTTDDPRLSWTCRLGEELWKKFVDLLIECGLARWEQIAASGKPKSRLVFEVSPAAIWRRDSENIDVYTFWERLGRG